jgi:hypothetical protein
MADFPQATRTANRLEAINQLRSTANIVVPFLQREFAKIPPRRLANDTGWYKATEKSLADARELITFPKVTFYLDQSRYYTHIKLKTDYSVTEWGVESVEHFFVVSSKEDAVQWIPLVLFTIEEINNADLHVKTLRKKITILEDEINTLRHCYAPFFTR